MSIRRVSAALVIAAFTAITVGSAHADRLQTVRVLDSSGKGATAMVCIGDSKSAKRFGGIQTGTDGRVIISLPETSARGDVLNQFLISASGVAGGVETPVYSDKLGKELVLRLENGKKVTCASFRPEPLKPVPGYKGVEKILALPADEPPLTPRQVDERLKAAGLQPISKISDFYKPGNPPASQPETTTATNIVERCFGAAGAQCGIGGGQAGISTCIPMPIFGGYLTCTVNDGSWKHDECCVRNPDGYMCGGALTGPFAVCAAEFNYAFALNLTPFSWHRLVNGNVVDRDGEVDQPLYCAQSGSVVFSDHTPRCCDGARSLTVLDVAAFSTRNAAWIPALIDARVCR